MIIIIMRDIMLTVITRVVGPVIGFPRERITASFDDEISFTNIAFDFV